MIKKTSRTHLLKFISWEIYLFESTIDNLNLVWFAVFRLLIFAFDQVVAV